MCEEWKVCVRGLMLIDIVNVWCDLKVFFWKNCSELFEGVYIKFNLKCIGNMLF